MNIAIFIDSLGGGGAERVMLNLAQQFMGLQHKVHFFILEQRIEHKLPEDLLVHVLDEQKNKTELTKTKNVEHTAKRMTQLVRAVEHENGPFQLHLVNLDPSTQVLVKCDFKNTFYVLHNAMKQEILREAKLGPIKYFKKRKLKKAYHQQHLIAVSKGMEQEALHSKLITPKSVRLIYNPSNIAEIRQLAKESHPDIPTEPYVVHAGRAVKAKRHDILFRALKDVPNIKLVLLCKNVKKVRKLAQKFGVLDRIITPGFQQNPYAWYAGAKFMVSSSDFEGLPTTLIESLICGVPVISTDCDYGPNEILTGELANGLVPVRNPKALAHKMNQWLHKTITVDSSDIEQKVDPAFVAQQYLSLVE